MKKALVIAAFVAVAGLAGCSDGVKRQPDTAVTFGITSFICVVVAMVVYQRKPPFQFPLTDADDAATDDLSLAQRCVFRARPDRRLAGDRRGLSLLGLAP